MMGRIANLIFLVNFVQASFPSLAEIVSRTRLCLGEGAHCPVNIYENFDACCKPLVCTVVPKTCTPNFFNRFFNISNYKDQRCMFPSNQMSPNELLNQTETVFFESTSYKNVLSVTASNDFAKDYFTNSTGIYQGSNNTGKDSSDYNKTIWIPSDFDTGSENESAEEVVDVSPTEPSQGSLLDSMSYYIDSNNEIRRLVKRYISNNYSSVEDSLSISPISGEGGMNNTFLHESRVSNSSNESRKSSSSHLLSDASQEYSDSSSSASNSGEVDDVESKETKVEEIGKRNFTMDVKHKSVSVKSPTVVAESVEDWHSSDMEPDSRPNVFKIVTVPPSRWFQMGAQVVNLNLSSEISE